MYDLTEKQLDTLRILVEARYKMATLDQILERLQEKTTKQSFQFTIRSLIKKGYIEKTGRRCVGGRSRRVLKLTEFGEFMYNQQVRETTMDEVYIPEDEY